MARYLVERNYVEVLGIMWMPACKGATKLELSSYDLENIGEFTRENVEDWLTTYSGDFQCVIDFHATAKDQDVPWVSEENEMLYCDCMYGEGE